MLYEIFVRNGGRLAVFSAAALVCGTGLAPTAGLLFAGAALGQAAGMCLCGLCGVDA